MNNVHKMQVFACRASKDFACKVIDALNKLNGENAEKIVLGQLECTPFSDG